MFIHNQSVAMCLNAFQFTFALNLNNKYSHTFANTVSTVDLGGNNITLFIRTAKVDVEKDINIY